MAHPVHRRWVSISAAILASGSSIAAAAAVAVEPGAVRPSAVLESPAARFVIDLSGGSIAEFRLPGSALNPLSWSAPAPGDLSIHGFGHFLCLDRWGPPSDAEGAKGMPYHGEASNVRWWVEGESRSGGHSLHALLVAGLPRAGLKVRREVRLSPHSAAVLVREEVVNVGDLGRPYNMVQHPTIAPPFLDERTVVDCNGTRGFAQGGSLPDPELPTYNWPDSADRRDGHRSDLRHLASDPEPNVASFVIEGEYGWITAASPARGLLIGYLWRTKDYPWVSVWRDVKDGRPSARGLEFGTTGLHQPFPALMKKGTIFGRRLLEYLDAGESAARSYVTFLVAIPEDYAGVASVQRNGDRLDIRERGQDRGRMHTLSLEGMDLGH